MPGSLRETWKGGYAAAAPAVDAARARGEPGVLASPRDLAELSLRLDRLVFDRREILADVADYAIEHPYEIAFGTCPSVASRCAASPTSVARLAHSLGFQGFRDMQGFFRRHLRDSRCWEDDRPWTCSSSKPTKVIQVKPSIGDYGLPRNDFISIDRRT